MSLQARRIGETQAQYRRRVGTKRPQTVNPGLSRQKVERVSVMPQQIAEPMTAEEKRRINRANLLEAQRRNAVSIPVTKAEDMPIPAEKRLSREQIIKLQKEAFRKMQQQKLKQRQKLSSGKVQQFTEQQKEAIRKFNKSRQQQDFFNVAKAVDPRTGKPLTQQQIKQMRATSERLAKEFKSKQPFIQKFMKGDIGARELRGSGLFKPQEIKGIEKNYLAQQFIDGKITDRQLSKSGRFSVRELRDIKRNAMYSRMSPEERRAFTERERQRQLRRQRRPDRRRRQVRRAYRRGRGGDRDNVITYQTTGRRRRVSPTQTQRRRVAPTQRRRRGMRVPI